MPCRILATSLFSTLFAVLFLLFFSALVPNHDGTIIPGITDPKIGGEQNAKLLFYIQLFQSQSMTSQVARKCLKGETYLQSCGVELSLGR